MKIQRLVKNKSSQMNKKYKKFYEISLKTTKSVNNK